MSISDSIIKVLNVKSGEAKIVLPLLLYSVCMGTAYAFLFTTATSLFLENFNTTSLPYAYMAGGVVSYLLWLVYNRFEQKFLFSNKLLFGGIFLLITVSFLAVAYNVTGQKIFSFLLFIWINVFLFVNGVGFWGIASKLFNLQQGKRLFGLISSGEVFAKVLGFFSVPFLLAFLKNQQILYLSLAGLIGCLVVLLVIINKFGTQLNARANKPSAAVSETNGFFSTIRTKYYLYILVLAVFPLFGAYFIDFIFLDQTKIQFENPQLISGFLGVFFGFMSVAEFLIKVFLSGRLISKYGILFALMVLPLMLFIITFSASVFGTLVGLTTLFFTFVSLNKLAVRVLRTSFLDPAFQIVYQPISRDERQALQSKVEGISKSVGNFVAGGTLILLAHAPFVDVMYFHYLLLIIIVLWIWVSYRLYQEYRNKVSAVLLAIKESETSHATSRLATCFALFDVSNPAQFSTAVRLTEKLDPDALTYILLRLLPNVSPNIQLIILKTIERKRIVPAHKILSFCLKNGLTHSQEENFRSVQQQLLATSHLHLAEFTDLANVSEVKERIQLADMLNYYHNYFTYNVLLTLLKDPDSRVRNIAIRTAGKRKRLELWPLILKNLADPDSSFAASNALKSIGEPVVATLIDYFNKDKTDKQTQVRILGVLAQIGGTKAMRFLWEKCNLFQDEERNTILTGLMNLHFSVASLQKSQVKQAIEKDVEIMVWIAACLVDIEGQKETTYLKQALEAELTQKQENVFLQLALLYDSKLIAFFINSFKKASEENRAYALEVLDVTIAQPIKDLILPLLGEVTAGDLLKSYQAWFPQQQLAYPQRLQDIINKDYLRIHKWTKCCAMELAAAFPEVAVSVSANFLNAEPILQETALWASYSQGTNAFLQKTGSLNAQERTNLMSIASQFEAVNERYYLRLDLIKKLQQVALFENFSVYTLVNVCELSKQIYLAENSEYTLADKQKENIFINLKGELDILFQSVYEQNFAPLDSYWYLKENPDVEIIFLPRKDTILLEINSNLMLELLSKHTHLAGKIIHMLSIKNNHLAWAV